MKISVNTELEEIAELRAAIAIIEDAIKRRENAGSSSEDSMKEVSKPQEIMEPPIRQVQQIEEIQEQQTTIKQEPPKPVVQPMQVRKPTPPPSIDLGLLGRSDYGKKIENRTMNNLGSSPSQSFSQKPQPTINKKDAVKDIVQTLMKRSQGGPIQMQEIISLAKVKNISESEARNFVSELQRSNSI